MKLYKFRPLADERDFQRAKSIIKTGCFWWSRFSELNDPMEGIFRANNRALINKICSAKNRYRICSFSDKTAFEKPCMWGYYANGFKGIAIEVEVEVKDGSVKKVNYNDCIPAAQNDHGWSVERILVHPGFPG